LETTGNALSPNTYTKKREDLMGKIDYNTNTHRREERDSSSTSRSGAAADAAAREAGRASAPGLGSAGARAKARSAAMPRRSSFPAGDAGDRAYELARQKWRAADDASPEAVGQKKAIREMLK
jgi:hypothetical protein